MFNTLLFLSLLAGVIPSSALPAADHLVSIDADYRDISDQAWLEQVEVLHVDRDFLIAKVRGELLDELPVCTILDSGDIDRQTYLGVELLSAAGETQAAELGRVVLARGSQLIVRRGPAAERDDFRLTGIRAVTTLKPLQLTAATPPPVLDVVRNDIVADMVAAVDELSYQTVIQDLQDFVTRSARSTTFPAACAYAHDTFEYYGLTAEIEEFTAYASYGSPFTCWNVIAEKTGTTYPEQVFIICGHLDSTVGDQAQPEPVAPGADDNASGAAAVLEIARIMAFFDFKYTLRFICFGAEEQGLCGSHMYAAQVAAAGDDIVGVINLDMLLYSPYNYDTIRIDYNNPSAPLAELFAHTAQLYVPDLIVYLHYNPGSFYSDHFPFWVHGYEAILGIEDLFSANPHYHETSDVLANYMSYFPFGTNCVRGAMAALAFLAQPLGGVGVSEETYSVPNAAGLRIASVRPNPARDLAHVTFTSSPADKVQLNLYDITGHLIWRQGTRIPTYGFSRFDLNVSNLASGVYFLQAAGDGATAVRKIIVAR